MDERERLAKVLIAEDDRTIREGIRDCVDWARFGMEVAHACSDGRRALEYARTERVDLLITDIRMPGLSGLELIESLRNLGLKIPVIVVTAFLEKDYVKSAFEFEAVDYILKPVRREAIERTLERIRGRISGPADAAPSEHDGTLIDSVRGFIEERIESPLRVIDIAGHFRLTPNHLSSIFSERTGDRLGEYILRRKIERATVLLRDPVLRVSEISERLGYSDPEYFSRLFRRRTGRSPRELRERGSGVL